MRSGKGGSWFSLVIGLVVFMLVASSARADRYVVAPGTPGANPESPYDTWAKAATNIQVAVDAATPGETIWVSNGTYKATGTGTVLYGITNMVHIATNVTLRSVNGPEVTILDGGYPDITNRVISLDRNATLSGFTVVNGRADRGGGIMVGLYGGMVSNCIVCSNICDSSLNEYGGGGIRSVTTTGYTGSFYNCSIYNNTAISNEGGGLWARGTIVMRDCKLYANTSSASGGGCWLRDTLDVSQCVFSNNTANGNGGGIFMRTYRTALFDDCRIVNNSSAGSGAGLVICEGGAGTIVSNCVISGNTGGSGAGCYLRPYQYTQPTKIVNCKIINNKSSKWGGGVCSEVGTVVFMDCLMASNSAAEYGGGFYCTHSTTNVAEIINCVIRDNTVNTKDGGAGAWFRGPSRMVGCLVVSNIITTNDSNSVGAGVRITSDGVICENNTVVGNVVSNGTGGGIHMTSVGQVNNTIIYGNTSRAGLNQDWWATAGTFSNCCTADITGMTGAGNIAADPEFADTAAGNYHLTVASPCVNAGVNQDWMIAGVDKDGRPRLDKFVKQVDIGCYEHHFQGAMFLLK